MSFSPVKKIVKVCLTTIKRNSNKIRLDKPKQRLYIYKGNKIYYVEKRLRGFF